MSQVRLILTTSILLLFVSFNQQLLSATKTSQASGNWSNVGTWGGIIPAANDDIIISSGTTVYINILFTTSMVFNSVVVKQGGSLVLGVNDAKLRIKGNINNDGIINLWQSANYQADIWLYGNSWWSGTGTWNLSNINVQSYSLEPANAMTLTLNGSLTAYEGSSFNKVNKYLDVTLHIKGILNTMISSYPDFYYGNLVIDKLIDIVDRPVEFSPSTSSNRIQLLGDITLVKPTDRLVITSNNTLTIHGNVTGAGSISGSTTSSLVIDNIHAAPINPLRIRSGTSFKELIINRRAGVSLSNGFVIRENLQLNNLSVLTLPSQTLTLGVNGANPTAGSFSGDGKLIGSNASSISIRGKDTTSVKLNFDQTSVDNHTLNNLIVDKLAGKVGLETGDLLVNGSLNISDKNVFLLGEGKLILNVVPVFIGSACLSGSRNASLMIAGLASSSYPLIFDQLTPFGNTLKSYSQSRNAVITLANKLNIIEQVSLTGNSSVLVSDGNLTLLSSSTGSAGISSLFNNTDVRGDVNVQIYISGDNQSMKYRGYRSLSSPLDDNQVMLGKKRSLEQLKESIIITGPGGVVNGFDQGGNAQPYAETLAKYNPYASLGSTRFLPITAITHTVLPGDGFIAFFRGKQMGSYQLNASKLNSPYSPPEPVTVVFRGIINRFDIPARVLFNNNNPADDYSGYNLIGNPYPSTIDWTRVTRSTGVNDEVITIKPGGGTATYLNGFFNNGGSPYIQSGQGFYVRTAIDGSTISFKEEAKTSSYPARLLNVSPVGRDETASDFKVLRLNLDNGSDIDETTIVFKPGSTAIGDYEDAVYFGGNTVHLSSISANEKRLAINFMPDIHLVKEVRLSVTASTSGACKLSVTDLPESSVAIFLKDSLREDELTEVKKNLNYFFTIDKNDPATFGDKRFSLLFKSKSQDDSKIPAVNVKHIIRASPNPIIEHEVSFHGTSLLGVDIQIAIYDIMGRKVQTTVFRKEEDIKCNVALLRSGVYVAKFKSDPGGKMLGETLFIKY